MADRPFIPTPHTASVEFMYALTNQVAENRIHVLADTNFDEAMVDTLWNTCKTWWINVWKPTVGPACSFNRLRVKAIHASDAPLLDQVVLPAQTGTKSGIALPNNSTFTVKFATGLAGRTARGRWYVAGLTSDCVSNGIVVPSGVAGAWVNALTALQDELQLSTWDLCITSFRVNKAWRTEGLSRPVTGISYTDLNLDSMRRRLAGRGR